MTSFFCDIVWKSAVSGISLFVPPSLNAPFLNSTDGFHMQMNVVIKDASYRVEEGEKTFSEAIKARAMIENLQTLVIDTPKSNRRPRK